MAKSKNIKPKEKEAKVTAESMDKQQHEQVKEGKETLAKEETQEEKKIKEEEKADNSAEQVEKEAEKLVEIIEEPKDEKAELQKKYDELNDKYLRLTAEFDNYRKRTLKEKMGLMKSAGEGILLNILPVVDNFERALKSIEEAKEIGAVKDGIKLIYSSFADFLKQNGVKEISALEQNFNTDEHEALTKIPAPNKKLKGKIVDVIEKGYKLNDKVIRYSKVVVGE